MPAPLYVTTAPRSYDYDFVETRREVQDPDNPRRVWRVIAVHDEERFATYQVPRYGSGFHPAILLSTALRDGTVPAEAAS